MTITSAGKVGIGTTAPTELLELERTGKIGFGAEGNYGVRTGYFDDGAGVHGFHIDTKHVGTWSDRRLVVRADTGRVGIGTDRPSYLLHTRGADNRLYLEAISGQVSLDLDGTQNHYRIISQPATGRFDIYDQTNSAHRFTIHANGNLQFHSYGAGLLKTDANGNVSLDTNTYLTSLPTHNHDTRYYTKTQSDTRYLTKGDAFIPIALTGSDYEPSAEEVILVSSNAYKGLAFPNGTKDFEFEVSIKGTNGANHQGIFWGATDLTSLIGAGLTGYKTTHQNADNLHIRDIANNSAQMTINPGFAPDDGQYHRYRLVQYRNPDTSNAILKVYLDGNLIFDTSHGAFNNPPQTPTYFGFIVYTGDVNFAHWNVREITDSEDLIRTIGENVFQPLGNYLTSLPAHEHDARYYTETEMDTFLGGKLSTSGGSLSGGLTINEGNLRIVQDVNNIAQVTLGEDPIGNHVIMEYDGTGGGPTNYFHLYSGLDGWAAKGTSLNMQPSTGKIAIGTTTFTEKFNVDGNVRFTGTISASGYNKTNWDTSYTTTQSLGSAAFESTNAFILDDGTTATSSLDAVSVSSSKYRWNVNTAGRPAVSQANEYGTALNLNYDGTYSTQWAHDIQENNLWIRTLNTSTNTGVAWKRVVTTSDSIGILDGYTQNEVDNLIDAAIDGLVASAPGTLDTLNELAAALGDDANFSTTVTNSIATKLSKSGGTISRDGMLSVEAGSYSYANGAHLELYTNNNHVPAIGFHRGGVSATTLWEEQGELFITKWNGDGTPYKLWHTGDFDPGSFLTSYTETDTLATVAARGNISTTSLAVEDNDSSDHWAFRVNTNGSNNSGFWTTDQDVRLLLRNNSGNIKVDLRPDGTSYFYNDLTAAGALTITNSGTGLLVDSAGHASVRLDRGSTSYDSNLLFLTAGVLNWRMWMDGNDDYLYIRDEVSGNNMMTFRRDYGATVNKNFYVGTDGGGANIIQSAVSGWGDVLKVRRGGVDVWQLQDNGSKPKFNSDTLYLSNSTITNAKVGNWDTAYGWGNHASEGYLTSYTETDTLATVTGRGNVTSTAMRVEAGATGLGGYMSVGNSTEVAGNYSAYFFGNTATDDGYFKGGIAYETISSTYGRGDIHFLQNNTTSNSKATIADSVMTILNGGNVGIGTTSPSFKLQANHGSTSEYVSSFQNTADNLQLKIGTTTGALLNIQGATINTNTAYNIALQAEGGNVGIGTTSPTEKLTVAGNILAGGSVHIDNRGDYVTFYGNNSGDHSITSRNVAGGADDDIRINSYGNVLINLDSNANNNDAAFVIGRHGSASGTMSNTNLLRVGEDGKVSIGKSSAVNSKMVIKGDGSYVGNYGYCTLTLEEGSGYPGLNFRQDSNNWLVRKVASGASSDANTMQFVFFFKCFCSRCWWLH